MIAADRLRDIIAATEPRLRAISDSDSTARPTPGKWSPREIVGHLIDSATNNHQRFVRAALQNELTFDGYAQNEWVSLQQYQVIAWPDLVALWAAYNRHIAHVMSVIPESARAHVHTKNNLGAIPFVAPSAEQTTLDYLMTDYVNHLEHHLRQISGVFVE